jgi:hypothetical protein
VDVSPVHLWRHDTGAVTIRELNGSSIIGYHNFGNVEPVWNNRGRAD